jgi:pimeloyl-ACP methyl ester carboxylesterase
MSESIVVSGIGTVELHYSERGAGQPVLLLHGGGGPASVVPWASLLAATRRARVMTPTHPGLEGTPRPSTLTGVAGLARLYAAFLEKLGLDGISVIGHSIGGWIAAEMGILVGARIRSLVLIDAVGIEERTHPAADVFAGEPTTESWRLFKMYAGTMMDPTLRPRLSASALPPTLLVWGEDDDVVDREYARAYAHAIAGAKLVLLPAVGHSPQLEAPELVTDTFWPFLVEHAR